jgi:hypothetical protein
VPRLHVIAGKEPASDQRPSIRRSHRDPLF